MKIQYQNNQITVFESALYRTTSTVIGTKDSVIIVDPNWLPAEVESIATYVDVHYQNHRQYLLFTHSDYDHIIGYGKWPDAQVIASEKMDKNPSKDTIIHQIRDFDNEYYISRNYPVSYPSVDFAIYEHGQLLEIGGLKLIFFHAAGHVKDGIFIIIPQLKCWIAGDYLSNIEIPFVDDDLIEYLHTLRKARAVLSDFPDIALLIPGHGDHTCERTEMQQRIENDTEYIQLLHRNPSSLNGTDIEAHIRKYSDNPNMIKAHDANVKKWLVKT